MYNTNRESYTVGWMTNNPWFLFYIAYFLKTIKRAKAIYFVAPSHYFSKSCYRWGTLGVCLLSVFFSKNRPKIPGKPLTGSEERMIIKG